MAENRRLLDIWIVETGTAYSGVPFETVANWLQQGRLLGEDRVRPAGTQDWFRIEKILALIPYLPSTETLRVEDKAEALEPVEGELSWRRPESSEEDDPDMIPLIDITLVLLIFFMMTAAVQSGMFGPIDVPSAHNQLASIKEGTFFVAIDKDNNGVTQYALGRDEKELEGPGPNMNHVLSRLKKEIEAIHFDSSKREVRVSLRADKQLPIEIVKGATLDLQSFEAQFNLQRNVEERIKLTVMGEVKTPAK